MSEDREALVRRLLPLVRRVARRLARVVPGADVDDLIGDGCIGLLRAIDAYDPTIGTTIEHYVRRIVLGAMLNGIRRLDPVSERVRRIVRVAERERYAIAMETGELPSLAELERTRPVLAQARANALRATLLSIDAPLPPDAGKPQVDADADPARIVVGRSERERIHRAICALPERQRDIVYAHYFAEQPLRAISGDLGISPQRASQLHLTALARLRNNLATVSA